MALFDSQGREIRKVPEDQLVNAINILAKRTESHQMQLMQLGMLLEFIIEKLSGTSMPDGTKVLDLAENEYDAWSQKRFAEIKEQAEQFRQLAQSGTDSASPVQLDE